MTFLRNRLPWVTTGLVAGLVIALFVRAFASSVVSQVYGAAGTATFTGSVASFSGTFTQAGNQPIRTAFGPLRLDYKSGNDTWTTGLLMREGDGNVSIGANITSADFNSNSKLRVLGIVESTNGGFKFPDGTTQTSAASGNVSGWTDGGANVYTTTSTDNVGIGMTPAQKLDVTTSGGNDDSIRFNTGNADGGLRLKNTSAGGAEWYLDSAGTGTGYSAGNLHFVRGIAGTTVMTLTNGNVGIGSTAPGAKLEVAGNINSSTGALQTNGVTRIANDGVGTFAAGTTIGGGTIPGGAGINSIQTFTSTGTWTKPSGVTKVLVEVQGGGGGGGGGADGSYGYTTSGGHGGAGGFCRRLIDVSAVSTVAVTIGTGGGGGAGGYIGAGQYGTNGSTGNASSFGAYCVGNGGGGGTRGYSGGTGGGGGTSTSGDINVTGAAGIGGTTPMNGVYLGQGLNGAGHGGDGGYYCTTAYCIGGAGSTGSTGNIAVWEYK